MPALGPSSNLIPIVTLFYVIHSLGVSFCQERARAYHSPTMFASTLNRAIGGCLGTCYVLRTQFLAHTQNPIFGTHKETCAKQWVLGARSCCA